MSYFKNAIDAIYLYRNGYLDTLSKDRYFAIIGKSFSHRLKVVFTNTIKEFSLLFYNNSIPNLKNKIVCIINSKNNYEALKFLASEDVVFIKPTVLGKDISDVSTFRFKTKLFYSVYLISTLPFLLLKKSNRRDLTLIHKSFGLNELFTKLVRSQQPSKVVFANDHIPEARSYIIACKKLGIETAYIQHGSVSEYFPPLLFDTALLESQYSLDTYEKIGISLNTKCILIGIPKLDKAISEIYIRKRIQTIGLAINQNDEEDIIKRVFKELLSQNYKVILRKHPSDNRNFSFDQSENICFANDMNVIQYIQSIDFLIASDSSIHVEANTLKCRSLYFMMHTNKKKYDYYNYIENNFIDEALTLVGITEYINNFKYGEFNFFGSNIVYYNNALQSSIYGKSGRLAKQIITKSI